MRSLPPARNQLRIRCRCRLVATRFHSGSLWRQDFILSLLQVENLQPQGKTCSHGLKICAKGLGRSSFRTHSYLASAFAVYRAIATAFSSSLISFLKPCPLGAIAKTCCRSVTSMSRKDRSEKSCVLSLLWVHIFPCGCEFSTCTSPTRWNLVATGRRRGERNMGSRQGCFELWPQVFPCGCEFSTCTCLRHDGNLVATRDTMNSCHRSGTPCPSRKYPRDSAEEAFSEGSFSHWEKGHQNCKSLVRRLWIHRWNDRTRQSGVRSTRKNWGFSK